MKMRRYGHVLLWLGIAALPAGAHPVAQGAMDIRVLPGEIELRARVSSEQVFVAEAFGADNKSRSSMSDVWDAHGEYLLGHIDLLADGAPLSGRLVLVTPPEDSTATAKITYDLRFTLPPSNPHPRRITVRQNVLNEFEFAPGNRWEATYVVRIAQEGGAEQGGLLLTSRDPLVFECAPPDSPKRTDSSRLDQGRLFGAYLHHGVMHILTGYDHLLFIAALVLAAVTLWDLVAVVTAFTLAHTITLALSVLDVVRLPSHIVEPMIAASIVIVALQNIFWPKRSRGSSRLLIAFGFGLFHGLGFAGGLLEAMEGLPGMAIATAIVAFSVGVELGHQVMVLPLFAGLQLVRWRQAGATGSGGLAHWLRQAGSAGIGAAGMFYLVAALR